MTITNEISLEDFQAWSGGESTLDRIINEGKCSQLESMLEDLYPDGMTDTQLNDLLWFESDTVFEWLGIRTYDQIKEELEERKLNWKIYNPIMNMIPAMKICQRKKNRKFIIRIMRMILKI